MCLGSETAEWQLMLYNLKENTAKDSWSGRIQVRTFEPLTSNEAQLSVNGGRAERHPNNLYDCVTRQEASLKASTAAKTSVQLHLKMFLISNDSCMWQKL